MLILSWIPLLFAVLPASVDQVGDVEVVPITHASLILKWQGRVVYVDPVSRGADYSGQPKADLILITHTHGDHLDLGQITQSSKEGTLVIGTLAVQQQVTQARVLRNGEKTEALGIGIEAVPAYNLVRGPSEGRFYHPRGEGNGYVLTFGTQRVYISGDTECTPEMKALRDIDIAFVCMNLPYTMAPDEAAECVNAFHPKVVYPYHSRGTDLQAFQSKVDPGTEVRLLEWYP
ncbi:MAG: MBL fold metallo-hydrolase [Acidobacteriota bacterium]|jgi:L-ascorbate metabolism protein UlaG (beta-lactamase superfamily)